ncbi:hypothetical protein OEA41_009752 [Lepraria neglecta]|uniref:Uncharacterized protein n=1 Tax=Lepraria neglecta TaxID=209136 RepID=A0AAE0DIA4_9LECA|nr:hypothetical protein OEA41_009752 [Lepraria neglecta]
MPEPAPALDGAPGAPAGRKILPQRRTRPLTHENLQPLSYDPYRRPLPSDSKPFYEPQITRPEAEPEMLLQPETRPISHEKLVKWQSLIERHEQLLREDDDILLASQHPSASPSLRIFAGNQSTKEAPKFEMPEPPDESPPSIIWMEALRDALVKATEPAGDGKRELKNVAMVRDALGDNVQEPSRLKSSPTRKYLPMILKGKEIGAQHDTGAEGSNFMTNKLAESLKLHIRTEKSDRKSFSMGTGMVRRAIGRVRASCAFAKESGTKMKCWFYVLPKLASPLIMGSQFLRDTKTMSHFTDRLEDHFPCTSPVPMVNLISSTRQAKRRLAAFIDGRDTYINGDSGSHLDLMSSAYVKRYRYKLDRRRECRKRVQLADATVVDTIGQVKAELTLPDGSTFSKTFDVLPGLTSEVLIGEDTLAKLNVFTEHESSFMDVLGGERHLELSILSHFGHLNQFLARTRNLNNRRSQAEHQCKPSLGGSLEIGTDVNFPVSLAKQQDDKMMRALHEQDLEAERLQHEKKRLEASGAALKKAKKHGAEQAPEPATQSPAPQSPSVSTIPQSSTARRQTSSHNGSVATRKCRDHGNDKTHHDMP